VTRVPWAATSRAPFASWLGELPRPRDDADLLRLVDVASAMLDAGRAQRVFDVHAGHGADGFDARRDGPYETWLARRASEQGRLPLFELGWGTGATPEGQLRTPSTLSYPDAAGEVQEAVVEDVGELLRELGLWAPEFAHWGFVRLAVMGGLISGYNYGSYGFGHDHSIGPAAAPIVMVAYKRVGMNFILVPPIPSDNLPFTVGFQLKVGF